MFMVFSRQKQIWDRPGWDTKLVERGSSRNPWKDIFQVLHPFLSCCEFGAGNGLRVSFWKDLWVGERELWESLFQILLHSTLKDSNISSLVICFTSPYSWDFGFTRNLNEAEVEGLSALLLLESVHLSQTRLDSWKWMLDPEENFVQVLCQISSWQAWTSFLSALLAVLESNGPIKRANFGVAYGVWLVNICDMVQRRRPNFCCSPQWWVIREGGGEIANHMFFHCPPFITLSLWWRLFREITLSWFVPRDCYSLLYEKHKVAGRGKKAKVIGVCIVLAVMGLVFWGQNRRIFEIFEGVGSGELWEKKQSFRSLFWPSVPVEFKELSFHSIYLDWKETVSWWLELLNSGLWFSCNCLTL